MSPVVFQKARFLWLVAITSLITFAFLLQVQLLWRPPSFVHHKFWLYDLEKEEPQQLDQICQLPKFHPFDPSILSYLSPSKIIKCKERQPSLTFIDENGILRFNETSLKINKYIATELECYYQELHRKNDVEVGYGERIRISLNGSQIHSDFVYVSCTDFAGLAFYSNIHCHILPKLSRVSTVVNSKNNLTYNVLIIGLDSLSRLSFIRNLPETYEFLTKKLNAFVFRGMTKIGDNTFPNVAAILTGKSVFNNELPKIKDPTEPYDEWPCIWKNFSGANYATLYAEDQPKIGLFNYLRGGLKYSPTDHYMRPFWLAVETSKLHRMSSSLCFGNIPKYFLQLNYTRAFVKKYIANNTPLFAFSFFVELSHDYGRVVTSADEDFKSWLSDLFYSGYLNNTFLFFLSDHGHRFDAMRSTLIGRIEERMPFMSVAVPPSLYDSNPEVIDSLKLNVKRLTTPYDVYFSVLDILGHSVNGTRFGSATSERGTSLFGSISVNRTCQTAGIPDHYCVCEKEESLDVSDERSREAADVVLATINSMVQFVYANVCAELSMAEIVRSDLIMPSDEVIMNSRIYFGKLKTDARAKGIVDKLRIIIKTTPGDALFEATVEFREDEDNYSVIGDISRINKYGSQSVCINDAVIRKYCYCKNQTNDA